MVLSNSAFFLDDRIQTEIMYIIPNIIHPDGG